MEIFFPMFSAQSAAWSVFLLAVVACAGLAAGNIRFFGVKFGIAAVMFSGIFFSWLGFAMNPAMLALLRDFGLILFVYSIGAQVGPGFFSSFRRDGLKLNLLAVFIMLAGAGLTLLISRLPGIDLPLAVGMYAGAVTNTPALAAAQQTLAASPADAGSAAVGYALAFPVGTVGVILVILLLKFLFRAELEAELAAVNSGRGSQLVTSSVKVEKLSDGVLLRDIPAMKTVSVVVSRLYRDGALEVAHGDTPVRRGDILLAVGKQADVDAFAAAVGSGSDKDLHKVQSRIIQARVIVTHRAVTGRSLEELGLEKRYDVAVTRVSRADVEFLVPGGYVLQFADNLVVVGEESSVAGVAALLGNSPRDLNQPRLIPVFLGIGLGVLLGSVPICLPGLAAPVKLGLAGGPLIAAILFSWVQGIGPLNWYMPPAANLMLRELGIVMFFSCVGLECGAKFVDTVMHGNGLQVMLLASVISVVPAFAAAYAFKRRYKVNFMTLCGALTAATTNPPALAFSDTLARPGLNTMAYATVYPLAMLMRIISAQLMLLLFR